MDFQTVSLASIHTNLIFNKCSDVWIQCFVSLNTVIKFRQWNLANKAIKFCLMEQHKDVAFLSEVNKSRWGKESHVFFHILHHQSSKSILFNRSHSINPESASLSHILSQWWNWSMSSVMISKRQFYPLNYIIIHYNKQERALKIFLCTSNFQAYLKDWSCKLTPD